MRLDTIAPSLRDPDDAEGRKRSEAKAEARLKKLGIKPKKRRVPDLTAGDYQRGRALDQRVRAKLLGF
jgi:hypothetical protein